MIEQILFALWFFVPAGVANVTPIFVSRLPGLRTLNAPMDFGRALRGRRIFGGHKTWRGLLCGIIMATAALWVQQYMVRYLGWAQSLTRQVDYLQLPLLIVGPLFGLGALGGDAIESFFKRQWGVAPGRSWFPFDQTDYIIGGALATAPFVRLELWQYIWLVVLWLIVHLLSSYVGYLLKLKERPI